MDGPVDRRTNLTDGLINQLMQVFGLVGQDHDEFITTPTPHRMTFINIFPQAGRNFLKHQIADRMAQPVIDLFEMVKINEQNRISTITVACTGFFKPGHNAVAVQQSGQSITDQKIAKFPRPFRHAGFQCHIPVPCDPVLFAQIIDQTVIFMFKRKRPIEDHMIVAMGNHHDSQKYEAQSSQHIIRFGHDDQYNAGRQQQHHKIKPPDPENRGQNTGCPAGKPGENDEHDKPAFIALSRQIKYGCQRPKRCPRTNTQGISDKPFVEIRIIKRRNQSPFSMITIPAKQPDRGRYNDNGNPYAHAK